MFGWIGYAAVAQRFHRIKLADPRGDLKEYSSKCQCLDATLLHPPAAYSLVRSRERFVTKL
ncbi:hypothetical protein BH20VER3_BH20VER3_20460 [soil metagenome]